MQLGDVLSETLKLQENWSSASKDPSMIRRRDLVVRDIPSWIRDQQRKLGLQGEWGAEGSGGKGGHAEIPWSRSYVPSFSPKAGVGWYLVYLFAADGRSLYLSLNQGTTIWDTDRKDFTFRSPDDLRSRVDWARTSLAAAVNSAEVGLLEVIDLRGRGRLGRAYQDANVWSIEYLQDSLPSEERLQADFRLMTTLLINLYNLDPEAEPLSQVSSAAPEFEDDPLALERPSGVMEGGENHEAGLVRWNGHEHAEWKPDSPTVDDGLQRRALAKVLATRLHAIRDSSPEESFLIHIDGPWGAGKSTLLKLLKLELEKGFVVVDYDAWRNSRVDPPWWALLTTLRAAIADSLTRRERIVLRVKEVWQRIRRTGSPYFLALAVWAIAVSLLSVAVRWALSQQSNGTTAGGARGAIELMWRVAPTGAAFIALFATFGTGALVLGRRLLWESARGARLYEQAAIDPMQNVAEHFGWLLTQSPRPVVFFIDDLDRCKQEQVVSLLEAAQTMMRTAPMPKEGKRQPKPVSFVVAADGAWLRRAYELAYAEFKDAVAEPGRSLGYLFLDKFFQLSVPMPAIGVARQKIYFQGLLREKDPSPENLDSEVAALKQQIEERGTERGILDVLGEASPAAREAVGPEAVERLSAPELVRDVEHALERFAPLLDGNPRRMKRYINCYTAFRAARTLEGSVVTVDALALWVLLQIRWPELAEYLQRKPDAIARINDKHPPNNCPEHLAGLIRSRDLRDVIENAPVKLTASQIRECCGAQPDREASEQEPAKIVTTSPAVLDPAAEQAGSAPPPATTRTT
ncbi:DUF3578 domain-containing protein [Nocardia sp. NPDC048505]|uniref:MrcB family domain-containing protein n=1 Tax=Nocardia sp. NPDC048505 TaxID=3155756 RepID=UPI0034031CF5